MSHIEISPAVWTAEEKTAEAYRATHDDHLPPTPFWLFIDAHYLAARDTGNLARFEHWHGPKITCWEAENHEPPASTLCPLPAGPSFPSEPALPVVPMVPVVPTGPGSPVAGSVPEPYSAILLGLGMLWVWLLRGLRLAKGY